MAQTATTQRGPVTATAPKAPKKRPFLVDLYSTAVGKKYAMAISGIAMMGFVLFHMIGNLKMYQGRDDLNNYAHFLQTLLYPLAPKGAVLWILRSGLVAMLLLHVHCVTRARGTTRSPPSPAARCVSRVSWWPPSSSGTSPTSPSAP